MIKKLFALSLIISLNAGAQKTTEKSSVTDLNIEKLRKQIDSSRRALDSITNSMTSSMTARLDSQEKERFREQNERNLNNFLASQRERDKKQTKALWIRGGFLLFALAVLIFTLIRKKKKEQRP